VIESIAAFMTPATPSTNDSTRFACMSSLKITAASYACDGGRGATLAISTRLEQDRRLASHGDG
jgi:hypothetical protein